MAHQLLQDVQIDVGELVHVHAGHGGAVLAEAAQQLLGARVALQPVEAHGRLARAEAQLEGVALATGGVAVMGFP